MQNKEGSSISSSIVFFKNIVLTEGQNANIDEYDIIFHWCGVGSPDYRTIDY